MEPIRDFDRETCDEESMILYSFTCTEMQEISTLPTPPIQNSNFSKGEFRFFLNQSIPHRRMKGGSNISFRQRKFGTGKTKLDPPVRFPAVVASTLRQAATKSDPSRLLPFPLARIVQAPAGFATRED